MLRLIFISMIFPLVLHAGFDINASLGSSLLDKQYVSSDACFKITLVTYKNDTNDIKLFLGFEHQRFRIDAKRLWYDIENKNTVPDHYYYNIMNLYTDPLNMIFLGIRKDFPALGLYFSLQFSKPVNNDLKNGMVFLAPYAGWNFFQGDNTDLFAEIGYYYNIDYRDISGLVPIYLGMRVKL